MNRNVIKFAIIGAGNRGIGCFGKLLSETPEAEITALCDVNPVRMKESAKKLKGEPRFYTQTAEMFKKEQLDAVVITSPDYLHEEHAIAALKNGVNTLVDKPLAPTVKGCKNIIEVAEQAGRVVMIGFNLRHHAVLKRLKKIIDDGILGKIFLIENREFYDGGKTLLGRWNRQRKWSGGLWIAKGCHDFDVFQWLMGFPRPVKVSSVAGINVLNPENIPFEIKKGVKVGPTCAECAYREICPDVYKIDFAENPEWGCEARKSDHYAKDLCIYLSDKDVHDNGIAVVEYDNGARASHLECFITPFSDRFYTVVGDRGIAEVSLRNRSIIVRPRWSQETIAYKLNETDGGHGGADPELLRSFINIVNGDERNASTVEHGMWSTAVGEAAEISFREDRTVFINELMK